jgi:hypothetical protein
VQLWLECHIIDIVMTPHLTLILTPHLLGSGHPIHTHTHTILLHKINVYTSHISLGIYYIHYTMVAHIFKGTALGLFSANHILIR